MVFAIDLGADFLDADFRGSPRMEPDLNGIYLKLPPSLRGQDFTILPEPVSLTVTPGVTCAPPDETQVGAGANRLTAPVCAQGLYAIFGEAYEILLPIVRNSFNPLTLY